MLLDFKTLSLFALAGYVTYKEVQQSYHQATIDQLQDKMEQMEKDQTLTKQGLQKEIVNRLSQRRNDKKEMVHMLEFTEIQTPVDSMTNLDATNFTIDLPEPILVWNGYVCQGESGQQLTNIGSGYTSETCHEECLKTDWCIYSTIYSSNNCQLVNSHCQKASSSVSDTYLSKVKVGNKQSEYYFFKDIAKQSTEIKENKAALAKVNNANADVIKLAEPVLVWNHYVCRGGSGRKLTNLGPGYTLQTCHEECLKTDWCMYTTIYSVDYCQLVNSHCQKASSSVSDTYQSKVAVGDKRSLQTFYDAIAKQGVDVQENKTAMIKENAALDDLQKKVDNQETSNKAALAALHNHFNNQETQITDITDGQATIKKDITKNTEVIEHNGDLVNQQKGALEFQIKNANGKITKLETQETESHRTNNVQMRRIDHLENSEEEQDKNLNKLTTRTSNMMDTYMSLQVADQKLEKQAMHTIHRQDDLVRSFNDYKSENHH